MHEHAHRSKGSGSAGIFLHRPSDHMNIPAQTRWPHSANTTKSGFEIGCTWSDMHEMSNNFLNDEKSQTFIDKIQTENLRVKNPNSLVKIQHYSNTGSTSIWKTSWLGVSSASKFSNFQMLGQVLFGRLPWKCEFWVWRVWTSFIDAPVYGSYRASFQLSNHSQPHPIFLIFGNILDLLTIITASFQTVQISSIPTQRQAEGLLLEYQVYDSQLAEKADTDWRPSCWPIQILMLQPALQWMPPTWMSARSLSSTSMELELQSFFFRIATRYSAFDRELLEFISPSPFSTSDWRLPVSCPLITSHWLLPLLAARIY